MCPILDGLLDLEELRKIEEILSENLRALRKKRGLTQEALAESAELSFRAVQQIEHGINWPSRDSIAALARALEVDQVSLFAEQSQPSTLWRDLLQALAALDDSQVARYLAAIQAELAAASGADSGALSSRKSKQAR